MAGNHGRLTIESEEKCEAAFLGCPYVLKVSEGPLYQDPQPALNPLRFLGT
jgi:hypothetical protein